MLWGGSKSFGSTKRKMDLPPRSKYDAYLLDKVNDFILCPNTMSIMACIEESLMYDENVLSNTTNMLE